MQQTQTASEPRKPYTGLITMHGLGELVVPSDYDHDKCLSALRQNLRGPFFSFDPDISDEHFSRTTVRLAPGQRIRVEALRQLNPGETRAENRLDFLKKEGALLTGPQGAALVIGQMRGKLGQGYRFAFFDDHRALWKRSRWGNNPMLPWVEVRNDGLISLCLTEFDRPMDMKDAVIAMFWA
jgi:hypothetical protein